MLFGDQIKAIEALEISAIEKAALTGKALIDYFFDQLNGSEITVSFNSEPVKKGEPAD